MSWYLTIRSDAAYSRSIDTGSLAAFLATIPELHQTSPTEFEAAPGQPWVAIVLAECDPAGNYACGGTTPAWVNIVELICSDSGAVPWYESLARRIAGFLGWVTFGDHEARQV